MPDPLVPSKVTAVYHRGPYRTIGDVHAAMQAGGPAALHAGAQYLADTLIGMAERGELGWLNPVTLARVVNVATAELHAQWPVPAGPSRWLLHVQYVGVPLDGDWPLHSTYDTSEEAVSVGRQIVAEHGDVLAFDVRLSDCPAPASTDTRR